MVKYNIQEDRVFLQDSIFKSRCLEKSKAADILNILTDAISIIYENITSHAIHVLNLHTVI